MEIPPQVLTPEFAAPFSKWMLEILIKEMRTTSKVLAAVPDPRHDYRPDPKSRSAWELAWHVAADVWFLEGIAKRVFHTDQTCSNPCKTAGELADWCVRRFGEAIEKIRSLTPTELTLPLTLGGVAEQGGYSFPTYQYLLWVHLHTVHHRGQLTTYLRSMGAKVPSIYGPSADEGMPS